MKNDLFMMYTRKEKSRHRYGRPEKLIIENGFKCVHCHGFVSLASGLSGVRNRNHCPYCLFSRHLDLHAPGDRLSACKALMQPVGLTIKAVRKKYGPRFERADAGACLRRLPGPLDQPHCCR
jgi:RNHCP domain